MAMTRKHFKALATALRAARPAVIEGTNYVADSVARRTWYNCVTEIAKVCDADNPAFDQSRFFDACGVPD